MFGRAATGSRSENCFPKLYVYVGATRPVVLFCGTLLAERSAEPPLRPPLAIYLGIKAHRLQRCCACEIHSEGRGWCVFFIFGSQLRWCHLHCPYIRESRQTDRQDHRQIRSADIRQDPGRENPPDEQSSGQLRLNLIGKKELPGSKRVGVHRAVSPCRRRCLCSADSGRAKL